MSHIAASPTFRIALIVVVLLLLAALAAGQAMRGRSAAPPATAQAAVEAATVAPGAGRAAADYWPTEDWRTADPTSHNVDASRLNAMMDYVKLKGISILGVVVIRNGYIVFEQYAPGLGVGSRGEVYSVTKSFASTLVGISQRKGLLTDLGAKVLDLLPGEYANVDAAKQAMTLEDVLTMRSGLTWTDDDQTLTAFYSAADPIQYMLDLPMASQPGADFNYCSGCSHLLTTLVGKATGQNVQDFAQAELLSPLGITGAYWQPARNGAPMGGWGLSLTPREMAKLGYLFLRGGTWDGEEIVTKEWVQAAASKHTTTDGPNGYGYQWWTHPKFPAYMALGRYGQTIYVNPSKDLVVAIRAQEANHDPIYYLLETYIEPAVQN